MTTYTPGDIESCLRRRLLQGVLEDGVSELDLPGMKGLWPGHFCKSARPQELTVGIFSVRCLLLELLAFSTGAHDDWL